MIEQDGCPEVGDFSNLFGLTSQHILDLDIPDIIKTVKYRTLRCSSMNLFVLYSGTH